MSGIKISLFQQHKIISNINNNEDIEDNSCIDYLYRVFNHPFPNIIFCHATISEIEKKNH
jgi:hypothetical protein